MVLDNMNMCILKRKAQ